MRWIAYLTVSFALSWSGEPELTVSPTIETYSCRLQNEQTLEPAQVTWIPGDLSAKSVATGAFYTRPMPYCR